MAEVDALQIRPGLQESRHGQALAAGALKLEQVERAFAAGDGQAGGIGMDDAPGRTAEIGPRLRLPELDRFAGAACNRFDTMTKAEVDAFRSHSPTKKF